MKGSMKPIWGKFLVCVGKADHWFEYMPKWCDASNQYVATRGKVAYVSN